MGYMHRTTEERNGRQPLTNLKFRRMLLLDLIGNVRNQGKKMGRPSSSDTEERLNGKLHILKHNPEKKKKDCAVCSNRKVRGGRKETVFVCVTCTRKPALCVGDCFEKYHTQKDYQM